MLLSHTLYTNVNGISDVADKVRQFAESVGWTTFERETGKVYGKPEGSYPYSYDLLTVSDSHGVYLCMTSTGVGGAQDLIVKIQVGNYMTSATSLSDLANVTGFDPDDYRMFINMCSDTASVRDTSTQTEPAYQYGLTHGIEDSGVGSGGSMTYEGACGRGVSISHTAIIPKLWMFGNADWVCGIALLDGVFCTMFHFGSFEMFDLTPTQGQVCGSLWVGWDNLDVSTDGDVQHWSKYTENSPPWYWSPFNLLDVNLGYSRGWQSQKALRMWFDSTRLMDLPVSSGSEGAALHQTLDIPMMCEADSDWDNYLVYDKSLVAHTANNRKPMAKNIYYWPRTSDGVSEPVCQTPCYFMSSSGLDFGQTLTYDSEQYMVFPIGTKANEYALAFRIA